MIRKAKKIIIILGAVFILAAAYFATMDHGQRQGAPASPPFAVGGNLVGLEWFEIVRVEFPGVIFERTAEVWEIAYMEGGIPDALELDQWQLQMMVFHLSNIQSERTVDESPEDISVFGFAPPSSWVILTDESGTSVELLLGDMPPSRLDYFAMQRGESAVFIVSARHGELMDFTMDSLRPRSLFPHFELQDVTLFRMETADTLIEVIPRPAENLPPQLAFPIAAHILTSPYSLPWGVNSDVLQNILIPFVSLSLDEFINDNPSSLAPYGLDQPMRVYLQTTGRTLDLLIGNEAGGRHFAKLPDSPGVFTISGMGNVVNTRPFNLINRFPFIFAIDAVESLTVTGDARVITASIHGTGLDSYFYLNGRRADGASFRTFYQAIIGLLVDTENPGSPRPPRSDGEIVIEFLLRPPLAESASITLIPYNRDFYILEQDGNIEFLISGNQVRRVFETADTALF